MAPGFGSVQDLKMQFSTEFIPLLAGDFGQKGSYSEEKLCLAILHQFLYRLAIYSPRFRTVKLFNVPDVRVILGILLYHLECSFMATVLRNGNWK